MKPITLLRLLSLLLIYTGCTHIEKIDTTNVKQHIGDYKIKKVSPSEIVEQAEKFGAAQASKFEHELNDPSITGPWNCDFGKSAVADSLNRLSPGSVRLILKDDLKNPDDFLPKEKEVLEAYQYSFEKRLASGTNIQQLNDTLYLYTYPVQTQSAFSRSCVSGDPDGYAVVEILMNKSFLIRQIR